ncbi:putative DD34D transposase [Trichonephila clavipes]|nr:putative DD34D transposase [Trichonephila clavipes]
MMDRISICEALGKRNEIDSFLKRMVTSDEKWVTYDNIVRKRSCYCPELANRRGVVFHKDNARPHTSVGTRQKLWELDWEVLIHPPYTTDLAPSDYYLFLAHYKTS